MDPPKTMTWPGDVLNRVDFLTRGGVVSGTEGGVLGLGGVPPTAAAMAAKVAAAAAVVAGDGGDGLVASSSSSVACGLLLSCSSSSSSRGGDMGGTAMTAPKAEMVCSNCCS